MLGIGFSEVLLIFVILLVVVGPDRLPDLARGAGKIFRELKNIGRDLRDSDGDD